jgi:hypothetical protein
MSGPQDSPESTRLQELYEAMRQQWLFGEALGGGRAGLALLLRQGVAAWVRAWPLPSAKAEASTVAQPAPQGVRALVAEPSRAQMATVLATMVWTAAQGATT